MTKLVEQFIMEQFIKLVFTLDGRHKIVLSLDTGTPSIQVLFSAGDQGRDSALNSGAST